MLHRFPGRLQRGESLLFHDAFDVLDHDNGVIDKQSDGEYHGEHAEGVDGEAEGRHHPKGTQQHDRNRDGGDQRGPEVLEKQEHDEEDEDDRLDQGMDNPFDRCLDEWCRVEWVDDLHTRREQRLKGSHFRFDQIGGVQGVCPGRQGDGHAGSRFAVEARGHVVVLHAEFDAGDIPEADLRAVGIDLQHDLFEIPDAFQA